MTIIKKKRMNNMRNIKMLQIGKKIYTMLVKKLNQLYFKITSNNIDLFNHVRNTSFYVLFYLKTNFIF